MQLPDRGHDAQPHLGANRIAPRFEIVRPLLRLRRRVLAVALDVGPRVLVDVITGDWHARRVASIVAGRWHIQPRLRPPSRSAYFPECLIDRRDEWCTLKRLQTLDAQRRQPDGFALASRAKIAARREGSQPSRVEPVKAASNPIEADLPSQSGAQRTPNGYVRRLRAKLADDGQQRREVHETLSDTKRKLRRETEDA